MAWLRLASRTIVSIVVVALALFLGNWSVGHVASLWWDRLPPAVTKAPEEGLKLLFNGSEASVDVILVHGLNGHRDRTWSSSDSVFWPQDLLGEDLPHSRIYTWGYDARIAADSEISIDYIHDHARHLVSDLSQARVETNTARRPIIFLAHSLGGIIVKRSLIYSDWARTGHLEHLKAIKLSTRSVYFFGTPHQGGNGVTMANMLLNIGSSVLNTNANALKHLARDSEYLQLLSEEFLAISADFEMKFFYEKLRTALPGGRSATIVNKASAVLPGAMNAEVMGIHANHRDMVRFASREDPGYLMVARALRQSVTEMAEFVAKTWAVYDDVRDIQNHKPKFNLTFAFPHRRNPYFVGRQETLRQIERALRGAASGDEVRPAQRVVVISGVGGIGKTQLVVEYMYYRRRDFASILWIESGSLRLIQASFQRIATTLLNDLKRNNHRSIGVLSSYLEMFESSTGDSAASHAIALVHAWLSQPGNDRWLLVFDSYDNVEDIDIQELMPPIDAGYIIITTRRHEAGRLGKQLSLDLLSPEDSVALLLKSARQTVSADPGFNDTRLSAEKIAHELGYLPLALDQAGAYISAQQIRVDEYLPKLLSNFKRVASRAPKANWPYGMTLFNTWELSIEAIAKLNPSAPTLLTFCSFMGPEIVVTDMLKPITDYEMSFYPDGNGPSRLREIIRHVGKDESFRNRTVEQLISEVDKQWIDTSENLPETLELLFSHSLMKRRDADGVYIHPLVQLWARESLSEGDQARAARYAVVLIADTHRRRTRETRQVAKDFTRQFYPETLRCKELIGTYLRQGLPTSDDIALLLSVEQIAVDLIHSSDFEGAIDLLELLEANPRSKYRAVAIASIVEYYYPAQSMIGPKFLLFLFLGRDIVDHLDKHFLGFLQQGEVFVMANPTKTPGTSALTLFKDSIKNFPAYDEVRGPALERLQMLLDLADLEERLKLRFRHRNKYEEVSGESKRILHLFGELHVLLRRAVDQVAAWSQDRPLLGDADFAGHLIHPLTFSVLSQAPPNVTIKGACLFMEDFVVDFVLSKFEDVIRAYWDATRELSQGEHGDLYAEATRPILKALYSMDSLVTGMHLRALPIGHIGLVMSRNGNFRRRNDIMSRDEIISELTSAYSTAALISPDPSPLLFEQYSGYLSSLIKLTVSKLLDQDEEPCIGRVMSLHILEAGTRRASINATNPKLLRGDRYLLGDMLNHLQQDGAFRLCENSPDDQGLLREALQWRGREDEAMKAIVKRKRASDLPAFLERVNDDVGESAESPQWPRLPMWYVTMEGPWARLMRAWCPHILGLAAVALTACVIDSILTRLSIPHVGTSNTLNRGVVWYGLLVLVNDVLLEFLSDDQLDMVWYIGVGVWAFWAFL